MKTRKSTMKDCMKCHEPPECGTHPEPCNIQIQEDIAIGDVVKVNNCNPSECEVLGYNEPQITLNSIHNRGCVCYSKSDRVIDIRKGPKTHTFEGVRWQTATLEVAPELTRSSPFIDRENMEHFAQFEADGKTYKMTLTEEG